VTQLPQMDVFVVVAKKSMFIHFDSCILHQAGPLRPHHSVHCEADSLRSKMVKKVSLLCISSITIKWEQLYASLLLPHYQVVP
jgi:hypothetical protein